MYTQTADRIFDLEMAILRFVQSHGLVTPRDVVGMAQQFGVDHQGSVYALQSLLEDGMIFQRDGTWVKAF